MVTIAETGKGILPQKLNTNVIFPVSGKYMFIYDFSVNRRKLWISLIPPTLYKGSVWAVIASPLKASWGRCPSLQLSFSYLYRLQLSF